MTDQTPIDDELISAYLDDEVTPAERAAIEADAEAMNQVAELSAVVSAVAAPVTPLGDADRDRILAAALDASETSTTVTSLATAKTKRGWSGLTDLATWRERNWRPIAAVAAAVALAVLAVPVVRGLDLGGDSQDSATTADEPAADEPAAAEPAADEPASEEAAAEAAPTAGDDGADETMAGAADAVADTDAAEMAADEPAADEPADEPVSPIDEFAPLTARSAEYEEADFQTVDQVLDQALGYFDAWLSDPGGALAEDGGADDSGGGPCLVELLLVERYEDLMSDHAIVIVDGEEHVVWLFEDGSAYVAPTDDCSPVAAADYFAS